MVNNQNPYTKRLPHITAPPPADDPDSSDRPIGHTAVWNLKKLQEIANEHSDDHPTLLAVTRKCRNDLKRLCDEPGGFDFAEHILKLTNGNFRKSVWCLSSPRGHTLGAWLPCDAYELSVPFTHPTTKWSGTANYYFKLCESVTGQILLFVSVHP